MLPNRLIAAVCGLAVAGSALVLARPDGERPPAAAALAALAAQDDSQAPRVDDFACIDHTGKFQRLSRQADARLVVLFVFTVECPIVRQYAAELSRLAAEFAPRGVRFLGLDPAPGETRAAVAQELEELDLALPVLMDETQCVAEMLGVERSAEALVIEPKRRALVWRGPIDDRVGYGAQREAATHRWLRDALEAALAGRPAPEQVAAVKGCAITYLEPREKHDVTYVRDVAPVLQRRCVPCHREGGIGPWKMDGHEKLVRWSSMTREAVLAGIMPPWHADPAHGDFLEDMGLTPEEARVLVHWAERGAPRGEGEDPLAGAVEPQPEWPLGPPDLIVEIGGLQEIPATGRIPNRDVEIELPEAATDRWVRAVDLRPSNAEVLHHAFAFVPGLQEIDTLRDQLDELQPRVREQVKKWLDENPDARELPPQYRDLQFVKLRSAQGRTYFAKYFPGQLVDEFPPGTGKLFPARTKLLFELHYTTTGSPETDRPRLGIYFHDEPPPRELEVASTWNRHVGLEPHEVKAVSAEKTFEHAVTLYSLSPHMHYRGRSMRFTAVFPDGTREILLDVVDYVFDWQANYTLREPRLLPAGTRIVCDAVYDNTAQNEQNPDPTARVHFGSRTDDEMFVGYIVYSRE